jgi:rifampin ADP-ribosylating transferase
MRDWPALPDDAVGCPAERFDHRRRHRVEPATLEGQLENRTSGGTVGADQQPEHLKPIAEAIAEAHATAYVPVTFDSCDHVTGPFFHGTRTEFAIGDELTPGSRSNYHDGRVANHVYFAALLEPAVWGAELAVALGDGTGRERVYIVEPTGPFEDDPNVTNKRFPGNVTRSYRTRNAVRIVGEVESWESHPPEILQGMLDSIAKLRADGLDVIED